MVVKEEKLRVLGESGGGEGAAILNYKQQRIEVQNVLKYLGCVYTDQSKDIEQFTA